MKSFLNCILLSCVLVVGLFSVVACDDGTGVDPVVEEGGDEGAETATEGEEEYSYVAEKALCAAQMAQVGGPCQVCPCNNCIAPLTACGGNAGCSEMMECRNETGCNGTACLEEDACGGLLYKHPGGKLSHSAQLAYEFFDCIHTACSDVCGLQ